MERRALLSFALVLAAVVVGIVLLATGGAPPEVTTDDATGDVDVGRGGSPPKDIGLADIHIATTRNVGNAIVFEIEMQEDIPRRLPKEALSWRWELYEGTQMTWILSANVDLGPNASVIATQRDYSTSTVDDTLPGEIQLSGKTLRVRIRPGEIQGFPRGFDWFVSTSLDGSRLKATSALAKDRAPDDGFLTLVE